jgi:predicted Rossmann fold flavoprotein
LSKKIVVIGAGPSGMMAAGVAAAKGYEVIVLEKNSNAGRKLAITGKGRCNITNACDPDNLMRNVPTNGKFLFSAFRTFTNYDVIEFFNDLGVETKVERGDRVFPKSDKAFDVVDAFKRFLKKNNVTVRYSTNVTDIEYRNEKFEIFIENNDSIIADNLVIATGGTSYTGTGSTGDGYKFAKKLGHTVTEIKPSLVPLEVKEVAKAKALQGLSLKNVAIKILNKEKVVYKDFGEMLFTHFGVTGPMILSGSAHLKKYKISDLKLNIDLKPALSEEQLDKRLQNDFTKFANKQFSNALDELLPSKMIPVIIEESKIDPKKQVNSITKEERKTLCEIIKKFEFSLSRARNIEEAIITSGGINIKEINPSTMESKIVPGLFFAGEVIDVDAYTGGFNLQIAYSTGYLAGENI